jgi:hypothetical protein
MQTGAPSNSWSAVASSADGSKLVAVSVGQIYTSTNSGMTWVSNNVPLLAWCCVAASADGTKLVAGSAWGSPHLFYASTNSGGTWRQLAGAPEAVWVSLASSADGCKLAAIGLSATNSDGHIYTSVDSGATWTQTGAPADPSWRALASSADGTRLVAGTLPPSPQFSGNYATPNSIFTSTNSGVTWDEHSVPYGDWISAGSSADGTKLVAASYAWYPGSHVLTSTDGGISWSKTATLPRSLLSRGVLASSANGGLVILGGGAIFSSTDSGATWVSNSAPNCSWASVACSADGTRLVASTGSGVIYTAQFTPTPTLNIAPSKQKLLLSWIVPSMNFHLQERRDFTSGQWNDVTLSPSLNLTNLQYELTVSPTNPSGFYRLVTP